MIKAVLKRIRDKVVIDLQPSIDGIGHYRTSLFTRLALSWVKNCGLLTCFLSLSLSAEQLVVADFSQHGLEVFKEQSFVGKTDYQLLTVQGKKVLYANSNNTASALYRELDIDLKKTPFLNWRWRVDKLLSIKNQQVKAGDDYPARVYVVVKEGFFPWQTVALNYIWSNNIEKEPYWFNPFTEKAVMLPIRSGKEGLGQWQQQRVNVREDLFRVFGRHIDRAHGVAIMSDGDNSGSSVQAYYGGIFFSD